MLKGLKMSRAKSSEKFHFENGLLKKLRAKAAPVNKGIARSASTNAKKAAKKAQPKSILSGLSGSAARRLIAD